MGGCNRRTIIKGALGALAACGASRRATYARAAPTVSLPPRRPLDFRPFAEALSGLTPEKRCRLDVLVLEATAPQLQADFAAGRYSASDLVAYYVDRIRRLDAIHLRSVIELNPEALDIAARLDSERSTGRVRGVLHGVPILIKDNIAEEINTLKQQPGKDIWLLGSTTLMQTFMKLDLIDEKSRIRYIAVYGIHSDEHPAEGSWNA